MKNKKKKILLNLGMSVVSITPLYTILACEKEKSNIKMSYKIPTIGEMKIKEIKIEQILRIDKKISKQNAIEKIEQILTDSEKDKIKYISFINNQDSWETAYYLIKHLLWTTKRKNIENSIIALSKKNNLENNKEKILFLRKKIFSCKLSINEIIKNFEKKTSGKDKDFEEETIKWAVEIDTKKKLIKIKNQQFWSIALKSLGGKDTFDYIFIKKGKYKIE